MNSLQNRRIFIVEDNLENRIVFQMALAPLLVRLEFDRWGHDTLARLHAFEPVDLIILDLMLPGGKSGFDIYDDIRAVPTFARTPIIAVSASNAEVSIPIAQAKGFQGYIAKPFDAAHFADLVSRILSGEAIWLYR